MVLFSLPLSCILMQFVGVLESRWFLNEKERARERERERETEEEHVVAMCWLALLGSLSDGCFCMAFGIV